MMKAPGLPLAAVALLLLTVDAVACRCPVPKDPWVETPIIFLARITTTSPATEGFGGLPAQSFAVANYTVVERFRNARSLPTQLRTEIPGIGSCGIELVVGDEYLVFTTSSGLVGECTATKRFSRESDIALYRRLEAIRREETP